MQSVTMTSKICFLIFWKLFFSSKDNVWKNCLNMAFELDLAVERKQKISFSLLCAVLLKAEIWFFFSVWKIWISSVKMSENISLVENFKGFKKKAKNLMYRKNWNSGMKIRFPLSNKSIKTDRSTINCLLIGCFWYFLWQRGKRRSFRSNFSTLKNTKIAYQRAIKKKILVSKKSPWKTVSTPYNRLQNIFKKEKWEKIWEKRREIEPNSFA